MKLELPLRLSRSEPAIGQADAFLLLDERTEALAATSAWFGRKLVPEIFRVRGGFLLIPREPSAHTPPRTIRLHRTGGDLYLPLDAHLHPALLPDEIVALSARQGLIVLPGGTVLGFDPKAPLSIREWLRGPRIRHEKWEPFPQRPTRAEKLTTIERPALPIPLNELLGAGAPDDTQRLLEGGATEGAFPEDVRPPSGPLPRRLSARARLVFSQFLIGLASLLRIPGLARLAGNMARRAVEAIPRLSEKVLGDQEAALRELLRQLRSGDIEKALRRAPVAVADPDRPAREISTNANLGRRDPRYSLRDLIKSNATSIWLGGGNAWEELAQEYRKLARDAISRGDFRRAAYLHGVLLRDLRSAANALVAGGLYRDAGILFRDRLKDLTAAADAFDRAGDHDEALRLYAHMNLFEQAGDLLKKLGDLERAIPYYISAAERLAAQGLWLAAGDLMYNKAGDIDHANRYYSSGWKQEITECGQRLLDSYLAAGDVRAFAHLLDEAETAFHARPRQVGNFFNYSVTAGEKFLPPAAHRDLTDRVRLLFAGQLRALGELGGEATRLAGDLFGQHSTWPAWPGPVIRDAVHATRNNKRLVPASAELSLETFQAALGKVTAVDVARGTSDIFIGSTRGLTCRRAADGRIVPVCSAELGTILAVSTDYRGEVVYVLHDLDTQFILRCFTGGPSDSFTLGGQVSLPATDESGKLHWHMQHSHPLTDGEPVMTLARAGERITLVGSNLLHSSPDLFPKRSFITHLLIAVGRWAWDWHAKWLDYASPTGGWASESIAVPWQPAVPAGSTLLRPPLDWISPHDGVLQVAGIAEDGAAYWSEFNIHSFDGVRSRTATRFVKNGYLAVCIVNSGVIAAATQNEVHWLRVRGALCDCVSTTVFNLPVRPVALVGGSKVDEVIAIFEDGAAACLQRPKNTNSAV